MADVQIQRTVTINVALPQDEGVWVAQALSFWVANNGAPTRDAQVFAQSLSERIVGGLVDNRA